MTRKVYDECKGKGLKKTMEGTQIKDFTKGNIPKQLICFACPLLLSNLLQVIYNMVDMIIVGNKLGQVGISAISVGGDVTNMTTFIVIGFANAGQVIIAQYIGAKQMDKIGQFVSTMGSFLMLCALIQSVAGLLLRDFLLRVMNTPSEAYQGALQYSSICITGLIFIYGYNIVSAILRGMGDSKHPFIFISFAAVLNLVLDILFVLFLNLGAGGAALATVISQAVSFVTCTIFLMKNKEQFQLSTRKRDFLYWDKEMLGELLMLGIPMAIKTAAVQLSKLFVNSWINSYGLAVSAFAGIANKVSNISTLISTAMNTAGSTMVGQNIACGAYDRVKKILLTLATITLSAATLISGIIVLWPKQVFGIFTSDVAVLQIGSHYVPIAVLVFFGSALRAVMNALINGSGNHRINFATALLDGIVLRLGLALLFGLGLGMRHYGFWLGDALAGFTPFWIGLFFYLSGKWKLGNKEK